MVSAANAEDIFGLTAGIADHAHNEPDSCMCERLPETAMISMSTRSAVRAIIVVFLSDLNRGVIREK